jgi:hypothetical protein
LAFLGRTSTAIVQDPVSSMRRQARSAQEKAPPGSFIAAWFWDIESGGMDLEQRGHGSAHERFDVGIPRDGGSRTCSPKPAGRTRGSPPSSARTSNGPGGTRSTRSS